MNTISHLKHCAVAVLLLGFVGAAIAEENTPTAEQLATAAEKKQYLEALADVASNRYAVISGIVATWAGGTGIVELESRSDPGRVTS